MPPATMTTSDSTGQITEAVRALHANGAGSWSVEQWLERIDAVYREAEGDASKIPWSHRRPCPSLENWLNAEAPSVVRPGARTAVVGCGLGQDVQLLCDRGYEVIGIDACDSALEWARVLHPDSPERFVKGDIREPMARLRHRFDLVVEIHTLQTLPPECRPELVRGMEQLLSQHGVLVAVARGRDTEIPLADVAGPPWELTADEMATLMESASLGPIRAIDDFLDDCTPPVRRLRGIFRRIS